MNNSYKVAQTTGRVSRPRAHGLGGLTRAACAVGLLLCLCGAASAAKPRSGLVFVLDAGGPAGKAQVLLVDPANGSVVRRLNADHNPDMALSPDGERLYVASGVGDAGRLDIYDAGSGKLLRTVANEDRHLTTSNIHTSDMAFSPDGKWLYVYKYEMETDDYHVATFDTSQDRFLPERASLPGCMSAILLPSDEPRRLAVLCASTQDLRFVRIAPNGKGQGAALPLRPRGRQSRFGQQLSLSTALPTASGLKVVVNDGSYFDVDNVGRKIKGLGVVDAKLRRTAHNESPGLVADGEDWMAGMWIPRQTPTGSAKNGRVYFGIGQLADLRRSDWLFSTIGVFDSDTLDRVGVIESTRRLFSIAVNAAGDRLYGVDPAGKSLVVFDTGSGQEIGVVENVAETPILVIAVP
jgi:DNA-binding beta-propeller fold protein YncE